MENVKLSLQKVVGAKCTTNLLEAYQRAQLMEQMAQDPEQHKSLKDWIELIEAAIDDLQSMSLMHDLYVKVEKLTEKVDRCTLLIQAAGISEKFVEKMTEHAVTMLKEEERGEE